MATSRRSGFDRAHLRSDLNSPRHGFRLLGDRDGQYAILAGRIDSVAVHGIGQHEATIEQALTAFDASMLWLAVTLRVLVNPLARQGQDSVLQRQFDGVRIYAGDIDIELKPVGELMDV